MSSGERTASGAAGVEVLEEPEPEPVVDEVAVRRQRRRARILSGLVAALLALAVGLGGVVYTLVQDRQAQVAQISLEQQLYAAPDVEFTDMDMKGGGKATFVFSENSTAPCSSAATCPTPARTSATSCGP